MEILTATNHSVVKPKQATRAVSMICLIRTRGGDRNHAQQRLLDLRVPIRREPMAETLSQISHAVNAGATEREVGDMIAKASTLLTGVDRAAVALADLDGQGLRLVGAHGLTTDYIDYLDQERPLHFKANPELESAGPSIRGFKSGRAVAIPDIAIDPAFEPWRKLASSEGFRSLLAVPLIASGESLGVLTCYCNDPGLLEQSQSELIESLAVHAAIVLESFQLRRSQERSIEELTDALDVLRRDRELHTTLMNLVLDGSSASEIIDVASDVLGMHVELTDSAADPARSVRLGSVANAPDSWLVAPTILEPSERLALESVSLVVALEQQRQISIFEAEARNKLDLLGDILDLHPESDTTELLDRALRHGFELQRPHRIVVLAPDTPVQGGARRLAQLAHHLAPATRPLGSCRIATKRPCSCFPTRRTMPTSPTGCMPQANENSDPQPARRWWAPCAPTSTNTDQRCARPARRWSSANDRARAVRSPSWASWAPSSSFFEGPQQSWSPSVRASLLR